MDKTGVPGGSRKVLLCEDDAINLQLALAMLRPLGLEVTTTTKGLDVLAKLGSESYDLILLDLTLPDIDGLDVLKWIRIGHGGNPAVPIIVLTARVLDTDRLLSIDAGASAFLSKPIDRIQLIETIEMLLAKGTKG